MEVVFAALFSVAMGREPLTTRLIIGGAMVVIAMIAIVQPRFHQEPPTRESIGA
jgi:drug/metabolite transporter (DMT)-like permease